MVKASFRSDLKNVCGDIPRSDERRFCAKTGISNVSRDDNSCEVSLTRITCAINFISNIPIIIVRFLKSVNGLMDECKIARQCTHLSGTCNYNKTGSTKQFSSL